MLAYLLFPIPFTDLLVTTVVVVRIFEAVHIVGTGDQAQMLAVVPGGGWDSQLLCLCGVYSPYNPPLGQQSLFLVSVSFNGMPVMVLSRAEQFLFSPLAVCGKLPLWC